MMPSPVPRTPAGCSTADGTSSPRAASEGGDSPLDLATLLDPLPSPPPGAGPPLVSPSSQPVVHLGDEAPESISTSDLSSVYSTYQTGRDGILEALAFFTYKLEIPPLRDDLPWIHNTNTHERSVPQLRGDGRLMRAILVDVLLGLCLGNGTVPDGSNLKWRALVSGAVPAVFGADASGPGGGWLTALDYLANSAEYNPSGAMTTTGTYAGYEVISAFCAWHNIPLLPVYHVVNGAEAKRVVGEVWPTSFKTGFPVKVALHFEQSHYSFLINTAYRAMKPSMGLPGGRSSGRSGSRTSAASQLETTRVAKKILQAQLKQQAQQQLLAQLQQQAQQLQHKAPQQPQQHEAQPQQHVAQPQQQHESQQQEDEEEARVEDLAPTDDEFEQSAVTPTMSPTAKADAATTTPIIAASTASPAVSGGAAAASGPAAGAPPGSYTGTGASVSVGASSVSALSVVPAAQPRSAVATTAVDAVDDDAKLASRAVGGGFTEAPSVSSCGAVVDGPVAGQGRARAAIDVVSTGAGDTEALVREVGTILDVLWQGEGATYRGNVEKVEGVMTLVYYPCDGSRKWHDFQKDKCTPTVVEPAAHKLSKLRRTTSGYDGQVVPRARWYAMSPEYIEEHFALCGESVWLSKVGKKFVTVPQGVRRRASKAEPVQKPYCVLGSLVMAFRHTGNTTGASKAEADCEESLVANDRMKFAAMHAPSYGYEPRKINVNALEVNAEHPTLLQVSRTHAVTIYQGLIFDAAKSEPLPLSRTNLDHCIGAPYDDANVRGYSFVPRPKKKRRVDSENVCPNSPRKAKCIMNVDQLSSK